MIKWWGRTVKVDPALPPSERARLHGVNARVNSRRAIIAASLAVACAIVSSILRLLGHG